MKRKLWSAVLAVCIIASVMLQGVTAYKEIVYTNDVSGEIKASSISLNYGESSVVTTDGSFYMWGGGWGEYTSAGLGNRDRKIPIKIMDGVKQANVGNGFYSVVKTDGKLYMWGTNESEQLGDGTTTNRKMPVEVLDDVVSVALEYSDPHNRRCTGAVTADGSLYMWGCEGLQNDASINMTPVKIMDHAAAVSMGLNHSGVLTSDGSLYLWGSNAEQQIGIDINPTGDAQPEKVMDDVESFSLGGFHSAAITKDGSLYMWGCNDFGQVGNGTKTNCLEPVKILDHVVSVGLGSDHSGAVTEDGSLYMWGANSFGQIGDGSTEESLILKKINFTNATINLDNEEQEKDSSSNETEADNTLYHKKSGIYIYKNLRKRLFPGH